MTCFLLLHGGMHHGSSWDLVAEQLTSRGQVVIAPDLPVDDEGAGASQWARIAVDAVENGVSKVDWDDVVVVGHSIAGLCVPVVAAMRPTRRMVFVAGLLPVPGQSFVEHLAENPDAISFPEPRSDGSGPFGLDWGTVREGFYHDCPEPLARSTFDSLRHQSFTIFLEQCPIARWPSTPSSYLLMTDDRAVGRDWACRSAQRVSADVIELDGGHSPFLARPVELSRALLRFAG